MPSNPRPGRSRVASALVLAVVALALSGVAGQSRSQEEPEPAAPAGPPEGWFGKSKPLQVPPFVDSFRGIDISRLNRAQRERFIQRANTEFCTCGQSGCPRHTVAHCHEVDPFCPRTGPSLRRILDEVAPTATRQQNDSKPAGDDGAGAR